MQKLLFLGVSLIATAVIASVYVALGPPKSLFSAGKQAFTAGDFNAAAFYLRQTIQTQPENAEASLLLGRADLAIGNAAAADPEFRRARAHGAALAQVLYPLGLAYLAQDHGAQLLRDFDPEKVPPSLAPHVLALRAAAELSLHDIGKAQALSAQAEGGAPLDPNVLIVAAKIALVAGDNDGAGRRAAQVLAAQPAAEPTEADDALLLLGEIAMRRGDTATALDKAKTVEGHNALRLDAKLMQARALAATGQTEAARNDIETVLKRSPRDAAANFLLTVLAIHVGDYAAADAALQRIGPAVGDLPRGSYFLAVTKLGLRQVGQAEQAATQFLASAPDDPGGLKLMAYIDLARQHPDRALALLRNPTLDGRPDADVADLRGRALAMTGDLHAAQAEFAQAASLRPSDPNVLNRLAAVELNLGNLAAGEANLKHSLDLAPKQARAGSAVVQTDLARGDVPAARVDLAGMTAALGKTDAAAVLDAEIKLASLDLAGAESALKAALAQFPQSRAVMMALVRVERLNGEPSAALAVLRESLNRHPADLGLLSQVLPELYARGETKQAVELAEAAHHTAPGDPALSAVLAEAYRHDKQTARAVGLLDRASAGNNPALDVLRARYLAEDGNIGQAVLIIQPLLQKDPGDPATGLLLAGLQARAGDYVAARRTLRDALSSSPGNMALLRGCVDLDVQEAGSVKAGLEAALATAARLSSDPANLPAAYALPGVLHAAAGDREAAAAAFLAAYRTSPSASFALQAATAAAAAGNVAQAIEVLENWTKAHAEDDAASLVLSSFYLNTGRLQDAALRLQAVLVREPANAAALNNLAWIRQHDGDLDSAKALGIRAYIQSPLPDMADTLGWILQQKGETGRALPLLKQAAVTLHGGAAYHYAVALAASGDRNAARAAIKDALASGSDFHGRGDAERFSAGL